MRRLAFLPLGLLLCLTAQAAEPSAVAPDPKLAEMFSATDEGGAPVITPEQKAYYEGLNDHLRTLLNQAVQNENITEPAHLAALLGLSLRPQKMEILLENNCILCHSDAASHSTDTLFTGKENGDAPPHMKLKNIVEDVHFRRGISCAGCHGGDPSAPLGHDHVKEWPEKDRQKNRAWVLQFCARCHSDPVIMHDFNPAMPTDQLAKFKDSPHGRRLLDMHDDRAPSCVNCHSGHNIRPARDPQSSVYAQRVPETCAACHANEQTMAGITRADGSPLPVTQPAEFRASVHGRALLERGDLGAPACNDCHGNHAPTPPGVTTVSRSCNLCHSANVGLFDGSKHKQAFDRHGWPECSQCHGAHTIKKASDEMLSTGPGRLCTDCHREFAKDNPECEATAKFFHEKITSLDAARDRFTRLSEKLAARGLDVEPISNQVTELSDSLKKTRSHVHSFSRNTFQQVAAPGDEAVQRADALVVSAQEEYKVRQIGLAASIAVIGLLMLTIYLKLRQMEKHEE